MQKLCITTLERVNKNQRLSKYSPPYTFTKFLNDISRDEWRKDRYNQIANDSKISARMYVKRIIKSEDEAVSTRLIHRDNPEINKLRCGSSSKPLFGKDSNNIVGETTVLGVIDRLIEEKEGANNQADNSLERMLKRNPEYRTIKGRIEEVVESDCVGRSVRWRLTILCRKCSKQDHFKTKEQYTSIYNTI